MKKYTVSSCQTRTFGDHSCGSDRVFPMRGESSTEKTWRETMVINLLGLGILECFNDCVDRKATFAHFSC